MADPDPGHPPQNVLDAVAKHCHACDLCGGRPCDGCMAGGMCDGLAFCRCPDEYDPIDRIGDWDSDEEDCP